MFTPGSTAPEASPTVPPMPPKPCAMAGPAVQTNAANPNRRLLANLPFIFLPPSMASTSSACASAQRASLKPLRSGRATSPPSRQRRQRHDVLPRQKRQQVLELLRREPLVVVGRHQALRLVVHLFQLRA